MLQVNFYYDKATSIFDTLTNLEFVYAIGQYTQNTAGYTLTITDQPNAYRCKLLFSKQLTFKQYKQIHQVITSLATILNATIDDNLALMGYLKNGEQAYIYHGWKQWVSFIEAAKHLSLEGKKVDIFHEQTFICNGILLATKRSDDESDGDLQMTQCTVLTENGEETFYGANLEIIATGEN